MPIKNEAKSVLSTSKFLTNISCISMNLIREKKPLNSDPYIPITPRRVTGRKQKIKEKENDLEIQQ